MELYTGCVENRQDPLKIGRCQVRVVGLHTDDKTILPTEDLPWAYPMQPVTSAAVSGIGHSPVGPVPGTWVILMFRDPDLQMPIILGTLGGIGTTLANGHGFTQSFTEHGVIIGMVCVRADLTYQQGLRKMWSRSTRYDFYFPAFAMLGEQAILNKEIYCTGGSADSDVFGYQERWAEYRYHPSRISSLFRSTAAGTIDAWHLAQKFTSLPTLNSTFIQDTPPVSRVVAVGAAANGQQFIFDSFFQTKVARPMPLYSVPGLIDHF